MSFRIRWILIALVGALALTACQDVFFHEPAQERPVALGLSYGLAPAVANLTTPQEDFQNAQQARVTVQEAVQGGSPADVTPTRQVVGISAADGSGTRTAGVRLTLPGDQTVTLTLLVELLIDGEPVLEGTTTVSVIPGSEEPASGEIFLAPVGEVSPFGTYELTAAAGSPLPFVIPDEVGPGCDLRVDSWTLTLLSDGTFTTRILGQEIARTTETPDCGGAVDQTGGGTFQLDGESITLVDFEGQSVVGTLADGVLVLDIDISGTTFTARFEKGADGGGAAGINGVVRNAVNQDPVANAEVELLSGFDATGGSPVASTTTNSSGQFSITGVAAGDYTLVVTATGFIQARQNVTLLAGQTLTRTVALSQQLGAGQTRIVLTWGASPVDLDSHMTGPDGQGGQFHVYFASPGSQSTSPYVTLDTDVTTGFGPETITIWQQFSGTYCYSVNNFSGEAALSTAEATVEVFQEGSRVATFSVPQGTGSVWTVFSLDAGGITPVDRIDDQGPPGVCQ